MLKKGLKLRKLWFIQTNDFVAAVCLFLFHFTQSAQRVIAKSKWTHDPAWFVCSKNNCIIAAEYETNVPYFMNTYIAIVFDNGGIME